MTAESTTAAVTALLASAFKLLHLNALAAGRAADNTVRYLAGGPILVSDPTETRAASERKAGAEYVTDGTYCTCPGQHHEFCKHRLAHRFALAQLALVDPALLVRLIVEQAAPIDAEPEPAPGPRVAAVIAAAVAELDDVAYLDSIVADADRRAAATAEAEFLELYPPR